MLFLQDHEYQEALAAKRGQLVLPAPLEELRQWMCDIYFANVVHIATDFSLRGPANIPPSLKFIFDFREEFLPLLANLTQPRDDIAESIANRLASLTSAGTLNLNYDRHSIYMSFADLAMPVMKEVLERCKHDITLMLAEDFGEYNFSKVMVMASMLCVMFQSEADVEAVQLCGYEEVIRHRCLEIAKPHDEFGFFRTDTFFVQLLSCEGIEARIDQHRRGY